MSELPLPSAPGRKPKGKPIDVWLAIGATVVGMICFLVAKSPPVIVALLALMFALLFHPVWNFWWVEKRLWRRLGACTVLLVALGLIGWESWPMPEVTSSVRVKYSSNQNYSVVRAADRLQRRDQFGQYSCVGNNPTLRRQPHNFSAYRGKPYHASKSQPRSNVPGGQESPICYTACTA
jgi:hypothetical protein